MKYKFIAFVAILMLAVLTSKAQNTGPVAPEAASFEPIDATDMVDLVSGDFSYVLPLMEVPGPSGGYPISLHYHAGVTGDMESSWVGLGWNLNPGSIMRSVNGVADDYKGKNNFFYVHDEGGVYERWGVGVSAPLGDVINVGVNVCWDSNKTWGGGFSVGVNTGDGGKGPWSVGASFGYYPGVGLNVGGNLNYSSKYIGGGLGISNNGIGMDVGITPSFGIQNEDGSLSKINRMVGYGRTSLGVSISSEGIDVAPSTLGGFTMSSSTVSQADYSVTNSSVYVPIITPWFSANYSHSKTRWYLKMLRSNAKYGPLYYNEIYSELEGENEAAERNINMDIVQYSYDPDGEGGKFETTNDMPAYDAYRFSAQGLNGYMSPRIFNESSSYLIGTGVVLSQDDLGYVEKYMDYYVKNSFNKTMDKIEFYFDYLNNSNLVLNDIYDWQATEILGYPFEEFSQTGGSRNENGSKYNFANNRLVSSNLVEWFTNSEISDKSTSIYDECRLKGFIETGSIIDEAGDRLPRKDENYFDPDGIGAFTIVKNDGLRYHYSLPVYQYETYQKSFPTNDETKYTVLFDPNKYATAWLLTAITGPDYVDVKGEGLTNDDVGYWVKFEYGKWTDGYIWKKEKEINDQTYQSLGRKQIYYLNSIETKSHIAIFSKSLRSDGFGYSCNENVNIDEWKRGQYYWLTKYLSYACLPVSASAYWTRVVDDITFSMSQEVPILKLDKILLVNKENDYSINNSNLLNILYGPDDEISYSKTYRGWSYEGSSPAYGCTKILDEYNAGISESQICYNNQFNSTDVEELENIAIKDIDFSYSNDLHGGHTHSSSNNTTNQGKLTLRGVNIKGHRGAEIMPGYTFDYYKGEETEVRNLSEDAWGFLRETKDDLRPNDKVLYGNLRDINFPLGGSIHINYESDVYESPSMQKFKYEFEYYNINGTYNDLYSTVNWAYADNYGIPYKIQSVEKVYNSSNIHYRINFFCDVDIMNEGLSINRVFIRNITFFNQDYVVTEAIPVTDIYDAGGGNYRVVCEMYGGKRNGPDVDLDGFSNLDVLTKATSVNGNIYLNHSKFYGGGLRTTSIEIKSEDEIQSRISYLYPKIGVTAQVPSEVESFIPYLGEVPAPGVYYPQVVVQNEGKDGVLADMKTTFDFYLPNTFTNNKLGDVLELPDNDIDEDEYVHESNGEYDVDIYTRSTVLKDNKSAWGRMVSTKVENQAGDVITQTDYDYFPMDEVPQGQIAETFKYGKVISDTKEKEKDWYFSSIIRKQYPSVLRSVTTSAQGISNTVTNTEWDPITGEVLETEYENSMDRSFRTKKVPAYYKYPFMGSLAAWEGDWNSDDVPPKNMLTQETGAYLYDVTDGTEKAVSASIQTWSDGYSWEGDNIWRKESAYTWHGGVDENGFYDGDTYVDFDYSATATNQNWIMLNQVTMYNEYSVPIEVMDINGKKSATHFDDNYRVEANAVNAGYFEVFTNNFENSNISGTGIEIVNGEENCHTGNSSMKMISGANGYLINESIDLEGDFTVSFWVKNFNGGALQTLINNQINSSLNPVLVLQKRFGEWTLLKYKMNIGAEDIGESMTFALKYTNNSSEPICIDDFRLSPENCALTTYVYNSWDQIIAILDANNIASRYRYDDAGRLKYVYKETPYVDSDNPGGFKKILQHNINYGGM